jgi:hypothetical protein
LVKEEAERKAKREENERALLKVLKEKYPD